MLCHLDNAFDVVDLMIVVVVEQLLYAEVGMVDHDLGEAVHVGDGVILTDSRT